jgi:hypothetical protein
MSSPGLMLLIFLVVDLHFLEVVDTPSPIGADVELSVANHFTDKALCFHRTFVCLLKLCEAHSTASNKPLST